LPIVSAQYPILNWILTQLEEEMLLNSKVFADSSAIVEFLKGNPTYFFMQNLSNKNLLCVNDVILAELVPAMIAKEKYLQADFTCKLPKFAMSINWEEIFNYQTILMKNGHFKIGISDLLIAQNCIQNNIPIIACDKHFDIIAKYLPLKLH
jgi:predicted nucleic acid-binding protein